MWLFVACAAAAAWWTFCAVVDNVARRRDAAERQATDPGRDAIAVATGPSPFPTGRHRSPVTPGEYR